MRERAALKDLWKYNATSIPSTTATTGTTGATGTTGTLRPTEPTLIETTPPTPSIEEETSSDSWRSCCSCWC